MSPKVLLPLQACHLSLSFTSHIPCSTWPGEKEGKLSASKTIFRPLFLFFWNKKSDPLKPVFICPPNLSLCIYLKLTYFPPGSFLSVVGNFSLSFFCSFPMMTIFILGDLNRNWGFLASPPIPWMPESVNLHNSNYLLLYSASVTHLMVILLSILPLQSLYQLHNSSFFFNFF